MTEEQYHIFSYYPKSANATLSCMRLKWMPDANSAIEHFSNSVEYVLVTEGWISLCVGEQEYFLETEDALCNNASLSHCYINNVIGYTRSADF